MTYVLLMMPTFSTQKKKSSFNSYYRDYSYGAGFDLGSDLTSKDHLKFSTLIKYDVHREHNDDEPTAVDKDRTYSFGLENTHRFNEQTVSDYRYQLRQTRFKPCREI